MKKFSRGIVSVGVAGGLLLGLTGCAVFDGRSPMDSPGNPSFAKIEGTYSAVEAALDEVELPEGWTTEVYTASENCSGPCNLATGVYLIPLAEAESPIVTSDMLVDVINATVPVMVGTGVDVVISGSYDPDNYNVDGGDITEAAVELFGIDSERSVSEEWYEWSSYDSSIRINTSEGEPVLNLP